MFNGKQEMIRVWNLHEGERQPWVGRGHYVGRPSPLGNPFVIGRHGQRSECIERFRQWLWGIVNKPLEAMDAAEQAAWFELMKLKQAAERNHAAGADLNLLCYCKPLACHADVIKGCLEWMMETERKVAGCVRQDAERDGQDGRATEGRAPRGEVRTCGQGVLL